MPEHRPHIDAQTMERTILRLLETRGVGKTICPSEAARSASGSNDRSTWEPLTEMARCAANRLVSKGKLTILQQGRVVDGAHGKGPHTFTVALKRTSVNEQTYSTKVVSK